jgi:hypothetical protein
MEIIMRGPGELDRERYRVFVDRWLKAGHVPYSSS